MNSLIESHNELLTIVQAYAAVNSCDLQRSPVLRQKISNAIEKGIKTKKSVEVTTEN